MPLSRKKVIFPIQGSNPGLPHCRRILYHLSHEGSPVMAESAPALAGQFFIHCALGKALATPFQDASPTPRAHSGGIFPLPVLLGKSPKAGS